MTVLSEVLAANGQYAADFGKKGELALPPARRFAILTCMDARLIPAHFAGLAEGAAQAVIIGGGPLSAAATALSGRAPVPLIAPVAAAVRLLTSPS